MAINIQKGEEIPTNLSEKEKKDLLNKAHSALILSMGDKVMREISKEKTAATIWLKLENLYMTKSLVNRLFLKQKLYTLKMPSGKALEDHLNDFNKIFLIWKKIEIKLGDEDHALLLLKSLPSEFDSLSDTLIWQGLTVIGESLDYFILKGIKEEVSGKRSKSKEGKKRKCFSCGSEEHLKKECHEYKKKKRHGDQRSHNGDAAVVSEGYESDEVMRVSEVSIKPEWVLDSGCTFQCVLTWIGSAHMRKAMEGRKYSIAVNNFGGHLPNSLGNLSTQLSQLYLGNNQMFGKIPSEIGNLVNLFVLSILYNHFEGIIPSAFGKLQKMQALELSGNKLSGVIPTSIGHFSRLFYLGLGENIGAIPLEIFNLSSLTDALAVSQNSLSGSIPKEVGKLKHIDLLDVFENHQSGDIPGTIGECLMLPLFARNHSILFGITPRSSTFRPVPKPPNISSLEYLNVSFNMLDGEVPTEGVFRNLYMKNGSLEQWLHPWTLTTEHPRTLNLDQRLNIIIDVASALHYLHHECEQPIIHCDLKPSNVLLDDDMVAHVNDFGIARLLSTINGTPSKQTSTIGIKGTVGNSWLFSSRV
ncbi:Receptor kinase-like protein Xa21 [Glycine soja]